MLLEHIAPTIVSRTAEMIDCPVSITDEKGRIIGTTDQKRIQTFHRPSLDVVSEKTAIAFSAEQVKKMDNVLPGVAAPIMFNQNPVGVLGIIGNPEKVKKYVKFVKKYIELFYLESFEAELDVYAANAAKRLIDCLLHSEGEENDRQMIRLSRMLGCHLSANRACLLFEVKGLNMQREPAGQPLIKKGLVDKIKRCFQWSDQDIFSELDGGRFIILMALKEGKEPAALKNSLKINLERLNNLIEKQRLAASLAVGSAQTGVTGIRRSYQDAVQAMKSGKRTKLPSPYSCDDMTIKVDLLSTGLTSYTKTRLQEMIAVFLAHDRDRTLAATFIAYCECNMNISETARRLFLHRNSLVYRLEKISALTSLNTSSFEQCLLLYFAIKNDSLSLG